MIDDKYEDDDVVPFSHFQGCQILKKIKVQISLCSQAQKKIKPLEWIKIRGIQMENVS